MRPQALCCVLLIYLTISTVWAHQATYYPDRWLNSYAVLTVVSKLDNLLPLGIALAWPWISEICAPKQSSIQWHITPRIDEERKRLNRETTLDYHLLLRSLSLPSTPAPLILAPSLSSFINPSHPRAILSSAIPPSTTRARTVASTIPSSTPPRNTSPSLSHREFVPTTTGSFAVPRTIYTIIGVAAAVLLFAASIILKLFRRDTGTATVPEQVPVCGAQTFHLFLDIDGTLVHSISQGNVLRGRQPDLSLPKSKLVSYKRPGLDAFLSFCFANFKSVSIWTAGTANYADEVAQQIVPKDCAFKMVMSRATLGTHPSIPNLRAKNLASMWANNSSFKEFGITEDNSFIVDDTSVVCDWNQANAVVIPSWRLNQTSDDVLARLQKQFARSTATVASTLCLEATICLV